MGNRWPANNINTHGYTAEICCFSGEEDFLTFPVYYDLIFMDIFLENANGISLADKLRQIFPDTCFIFITNSRGYGVEAFQLDAVHYLVKPITPGGVQTAMNRCMARLEKKPGQKTLQFKPVKAPGLVTLCAPLLSCAVVRYNVRMLVI